MLPWDDIDTVLLDMDGTLLDLHFDYQVWHHRLPERLAARDGRPLPIVLRELRATLAAKEGILDWYCHDHWTRVLGIPIDEVEEEISHLIDLRPAVVPFLEQVAARGAALVLTTNAHPRSLALKMARTGLASHFTRLISSHEFGVVKEDPLFWQRLQAVVPHEGARTVFVDDNVACLRAARGAGISHLFGIRKPNSQAPDRDAAEFVALHSLLDLFPPQSPLIGSP